MIRLMLAVIFAFLFSQQTLKAQESRPLSEILMDLDGFPESKMIEIATQQAAQQFNIDQGPNYKSAPKNQNNNPKIVSDEKIFEGQFYAASNSTKLVIFSDDGCDVFINGKKVLPNFMKGQHLPNLKQSLVDVPYKFNGGQVYKIKVRYSNTIYQGDADIDGCTLFALGGGGGGGRSQARH